MGMSMMDRSGNVVAMDVVVVVGEERERERDGYAQS